MRFVNKGHIYLKVCLDVFGDVSSRASAAVHSKLQTPIPNIDYFIAKLQRTWSFSLSEYMISATSTAMDSYYCIQCTLTSIISKDWSEININGLCECPLNLFRVSKILSFAINSNTTRRYKDASETQRYSNVQTYLTNFIYGYEIFDICIVTELWGFSSQFSVLQGASPLFSLFVVLVINF